MEVGENSILFAVHLGESVALGWRVANTRPTDRDILGVADGDTTEAWAIVLPKYFLYFTMLVSGNKTKIYLSNLHMNCPLK